MLNLRQRHRQPELMDAPHLDAQQHHAALTGLRRVNYFSRTTSVIWDALQPLIRSEQRRLSVLDIGCGGGDLVAQLAQRFRAAGLQYQIEGCDISATAVAYAKSAYADDPHVRFSVRNVLSDPPEPAGCDVVICTLFLHHLDEADAVALLRCMGAAAGHLVIVDDLLRSAAGYALAWLGTRMLTRSRIVHVDGPLSVQGAFTIPEVRQLATQAGLTGVAIHNHWPQRFLLTANGTRSRTDFVESKFSAVTDTK
ncbi:MAG: methyltransferase domain-containing protein [Planctomycetaceae bacterium]|nr:methyltransferase domain-containing protein [Planctomycetaceae bacterium]